MYVVPHQTRKEGLADMKHRDKVCEYCDSTFQDLSWHNNRKYCSETCSYSAKSGVRDKDKDNGNDKENWRRCLDCGESMRFGTSPYCEDCDPTSKRNLDRSLC